MFGWGLYFAENPEVAEGYRRVLLPVSVTMVMKNGKKYGNYSLNGVVDLRKFDFRNSFGVDMDGYDLGALMFVNSVLYNYYGLSRGNNKLPSRQEFIDYVEDYFDTMLLKISGGMDSVLKVFDDIKEIAIPSREGSIYKVEIPENDVLLDWDASIDEQPEKVKKAMKTIVEILNAKGILSSTSLEQAETGRDFYHALESIMNDYIAEKGFNVKGFGEVTRGDMAASLILNAAGIPGLRYFDGFSRVDQKGTHNFVIWKFYLF